MATPVPTVHERLARCGTRVYVTGLVPTAEVIVSVVDAVGTISEFTQTATGGSHTFVVPSLVAGAVVRAKQDAGAGFTPWSPPVTVEDAVVPPVSGPGLPESVGACSRCVWVDGLVPGAEVKLWVGLVLVGQDMASRHGKACVFVSIPEDKRRAGTTLRARMSVCGALSPASSTTLATEPPLLKPKIFDVTYPSDSYLGYAYLARHLARWGMLVFSIRMDDANFPQATGSGADPGKLYQYARAEIIFTAISELLADPAWNTRINRDRIGLIGHSIAGEAVGLAQWLNATENRGFGIEAVVAIAPVLYRPEYVVQSKYMQIIGSMDFLLGDPALLTGPDPDPDAAEPGTGSTSGVRAYDRAWRLSKSHFFVYGALHHPFNTVREDVLETAAATPQAISRAEHERLAKCLVNAFLQDALLGKAEYAGYMAGIVFPRSLYDFEIHTQHARLTALKVVDNFGDEDAPALIPAEALNKASNTKGQPVTVTGGASEDWEDLEHMTLSNSPHNAKGARLSWSAPGVLYRSLTGGLSAALTNVLSLRVAQFYPDDARNPEDQPADLFVTLSDGVHEATVRLGAVAQIPYPVAAVSTMRTVRLPIDAFKAANPAFRPAGIESVALWLSARPTGNVLIDDLEFSG